MTIFDIINDILFFKKKNILDNIDSESVFSPYMVNRWISMYSNTAALNCNIINKYLNFSNCKQQIYNLFFYFFKKAPQRRITYYKKTRESSTNEQQPIEGKALEISRRELELYQETLNILKKK